MLVYPAKSTYAPGESVTLTAVPVAGHVFGDWSGQTEGISDLSRNPVTFAMGDRPDNNRVITANFVESDIKCAIVSNSDPISGGLVQLQPAQPTGGYPVNQSVSVRAAAQTGYAFSHWTGDLTGTESLKDLIVAEDKSFTAVFYPTVTIQRSPTEGGSVLLQPEFPGGYPIGTEVTMTAKANKGYRFASWEGDASGSVHSVTFTVDAPMTMTAVFMVESPSRWWLWVIPGLLVLFGALIILRLMYLRLKSGRSGETYWSEE